MSGGDLDVEDHQGCCGRVWCWSRDAAHVADQYRDTHGGTEAELSVDERARLKELERVVQDLRAETAFLKNASAYFARDQRL